MILFCLCLPLLNRTFGKGVDVKELIRQACNTSIGGKFNESAVKYHCTVVVTYGIYFKEKALNSIIHKKRGRTVIYERVS